MTESSHSIHLRFPGARSAGARSAGARSAGARSAWLVLATLTLTLALALATALTATATHATNAYADGTQSGTMGSCAWVLENGALTVSPQQGKSTGTITKDQFRAVMDSHSVTKTAFKNTVKIDGTAKELFKDYSSLTSIDLSGLDTSEATNTGYMFYGCESLKALNLSGLDTSKVTDMGSMFDGCSSLETLNLSGLDTSKVTDMWGMFAGCSSLKSLNLSPLDTSMVTNMYLMFSGCSSLTSLNLSSLDTSKVTNMGYLFDGCSSLKSLDLSGFDTSSVTDMGGMFYDCSSLKSLDLSGLDTSKVTYMWGMFSNCSLLETLKLSGLSTSDVTNMGYLFCGCSSLKSLDLSRFDTSKVEDMGYMFCNCSSLASLDLSGFNTSKVTSMGSMLCGCSSLKSLNLSGFDTSKVTNMGYLFYGCSSLETVYASDSFSTQSAYFSINMFSGCTKLVGGNGTAFDAAHADGSYARVDKSGTPGYFTAVKKTVAIAVPTAKTGLTYNESVKTGVAAGEGYTLTGTVKATNAGSYTATATLKAGYKWSDGTTGKKTIKWSIKKATYNMSGVSFAGATFTYDGKSYGLSIVGELPKGVTVSYEGNGQASAGTYTVTATFAGDAANYRAIASKTATLKIKAQALKSSRVTLSATSLAYTGSKAVPAVTVKNAAGARLGTASYSVAYYNAAGKKVTAPKSVGTYTVKVTGKGNYKGTVKTTYKINPKGTTVSKVTAASKAFTVKWAKQADQTTGYQVRYSTSSGMKNAVTKTVSKTGTTSLKVAKLKAKTKYYVQVRTYKKVTVNGKTTTYYSGWSAVKAVTTTA